MKERPELKLIDKEIKQIEYQRKFGYGKIVVYLEAGRPVRIEEGVKSTKL